MDKVLVAEVFHSTGNVGHKLDEHLRGKVLQDNEKRGLLSQKCSRHVISVQ